MTGVAGHHHGELLQGVVARGGEWVACLLTLPAPGIGSTARFVPAHTVLEVVPAWKTKAARAASLTLELLGAPRGGRLSIECRLATGVGLGSSTCDVVAGIRAVCAAHGAALTRHELARLAVAAEGASDPIMFDDEMVLFAQRRAEVLESFGTWVPRYTVVSVDTDAAGGGIDTLSLPIPAYSNSELDAFAALLARAREAFSQRDAREIAAIAGASARLNQRFVPMRGFTDIVRAAEDFGALGVQISHSGTVAGILFAAAPAGGFDGLTARLRSLGMRPRGVFDTGAIDGGGDAP